MGSNESLIGALAGAGVGAAIAGFLNKHTHKMPGDPPPPVLLGALAGGVGSALLGINGYHYGSSTIGPPQDNSNTTAGAPTSDVYVGDPPPAGIEGVDWAWIEKPSWQPVEPKNQISYEDWCKLNFDPDGKFCPMPPFRGEGGPEIEPKKLGRKVILD